MFLVLCFINVHVVMITAHLYNYLFEYVLLGVIIVQTVRMIRFEKDLLINIINSLTLFIELYFSLQTHFLKMLLTQLLTNPSYIDG